MNAMTCEQVQEQLDLLAAGECDPPMQAALEQHLGTCSACAAGYAESQRLMAMLNRQWPEAGLERLRQRIDAQARPARRLRLFSPIVRRALAAAAVLLIAIGLIWKVPDWTSDKPSETPFVLVVAMGHKPLKLDDMVAEKVRVQPPAPGIEAKALKAILERDGMLPAPPAVDVHVALVNRSKKTVALRHGDLEPSLTLEIEGDGVVRIAAAKGEPPAFLRPQTVHLEPGEQFLLHVDRLIAGSASKREYIYLTEPGDYTLTILLRVTIDGQVVTVIGDPETVKVEK